MAKNKITMKMVEKDYDKYKETVGITFDDTDPNTGEEKEYTITLFPYFEPSRINNVLMSMRDDLSDLEKRDDISLKDENIPLFVIYHSILEFTDIPKPRSKDIQRRFSYFTSFINSKYFGIVQEYLLQEEISKVWNKVMELMAEDYKLKRIAAKAQEEIRNYDFKSPELRDAVLGQLNIGKKIPEA